MKSLEKLREYADEKWEPWAASREHMHVMIDEIEREVAERYMELPVDADGVPIRVGDMIERDEDGFCVIGVAPKLCFVQDGLIAPAKPMYYRHVKPRTLEDVLGEYSSQVFGITTEEHDELIAKYAAEIRELLGGVGE